MTTEYGIFDKDMKLLQDGFGSRVQAQATATFDYQGEVVTVAELCECGRKPKVAGSLYCMDCDLEEEKVYEHKTLPHDDPHYDDYDPHYDPFY